MVADLLTKPLRGMAFQKLRARLLNLKDDPDTLDNTPDHRSVLGKVLKDQIAPRTERCQK